jgi:hypothetical protein
MAILHLRLQLGETEMKLSVEFVAQPQCLRVEMETAKTVFSSGEGK